MARWRHRKIRITSVMATPVVVPLQVTPSPGALAVRYMLRAGTDRGLVGLGESSPRATLEQLRDAAVALVGKPLEDLAHSHLPLAPTPAYEAMELVVYDILGQAHRMPVYQLLGGRRRDSVPGRATPLSREAVANAFLEWPGERDGLSLLRSPAREFQIAAPMAISVRWCDVIADTGRSAVLVGEMDLGVREAGRLHACLASAACGPSDLHGRALRQHDLLVKPLQHREGEYQLANEPGLGVQLDPDALREYRCGADIELARI